MARTIISMSKDAAPNAMAIISGADCSEPAARFVFVAKGLVGGKDGGGAGEGGGGGAGEGGGGDGGGGGGDGGGGDGGGGDGPPRRAASQSRQVCRTVREEMQVYRGLFQCANSGRAEVLGENLDLKQYLLRSTLQRSNERSEWGDHAV